MSNPEANAPKRKLSNWVFVVGALILAYLVTYFGGLTSETSKTTFMGSVFKIDVINPAAVAVEFQLRNVGSENGIPDCIVKVQDVSGTYYNFTELVDYKTNYDSFEDLVDYEVCLPREECSEVVVAGLPTDAYKIFFGNKRKGDLSKLVCTAKKAKKILKWKPKFSTMLQIITDEFKWQRYLLNKKVKIKTIY